MATFPIPLLLAYFCSCHDFCDSPFNTTLTKFVVRSCITQEKVVATGARAFYCAIIINGISNHGTERKNYRDSCLFLFEANLSVPQVN